MEFMLKPQRGAVGSQWQAQVLALPAFDAWRVLG